MAVFLYPFCLFCAVIHKALHGCGKAVALVIDVDVSRSERVSDFIIHQILGGLHVFEQGVAQKHNALAGTGKEIECVEILYLPDDGGMNIFVVKHTDSPFIHVFTLFMKYKGVISKKIDGNSREFIVQPFARDNILQGNSVAFKMLVDCVGRWNG